MARTMQRTALILLLLISALLPRLTQAQTNTSLRFNGTGRDGVDRVVIPLDSPPRALDVGADFTIEFWLKALPGENASAPCNPGGDNWINGNIIIDRDIYFAGDYGDYGISLAGGRVAFGVNNGTEGTTLCGITDIADGQWHHLALTRSAADGGLAIFIDGRRDAQAPGPLGDISYRDGRPTDYPNDPFLVIGAEKHDAGPEYPSFHGWIDELRVSTIVRYPTDFTRPNAPFTADADTAALYHFDEGAGEIVRDSAGAPGTPADGRLRIGGSPPGPVWSDDTPWASLVSPAPTAPPTETALIETITPAPDSTATPVSEINAATATIAEPPTAAPTAPPEATIPAMTPTVAPTTPPNPADQAPAPTASAAPVAAAPDATPRTWLVILIVLGLILAGGGIILIRRR